jgi:Reverse transcriptase (RNA-dependent DNA polymerase)
MNIYAFVVKLALIRILFAIAVIFELKIQQINIVTTFLTKELKKEIYIKQSEEFEVENRKNYVYRLQKSLYELKQVLQV